ncbi:ScbA/BarX family gamma-butyrolactone biosynthesis protein [Streptomyces sp. NPDC006259]|uniref:ScbA/BarX family gamma-butyrolactone biosynthesis protein n=1 Tax=Streptomyces sp. NPDC006259 TaxID=3364740 RepID=UPI0036BEF42B
MQGTDRHATEVRPHAPRTRPTGRDHWSDAGTLRATVHKRAAAEVFLTNAVQVADDRFSVAVRWPREHGLYQPGPRGDGDPLLWIETVRQAGIHLSHRFYGVPMHHPFVLAEVTLAVGPSAGSRVAHPAPVTLDVVVRREAQDTRRMAASAEAVVLAGGRAMGRVGLRWQAVDPVRYAVLRRRNSPSQPIGAVPGDADAVPLTAGAVGRARERDVMLAATRDDDTWMLRLDTGHPVFFDHAVDHIPGMALLEALAQAAAVGTARAAGPAATRTTGCAPRASLLRSGTFVFEAFGELDAPVTVTTRATSGPASADDASALCVSAVQGDRTLVRADLLYGPASCCRPDGDAAGGHR